MFFKMQNVFFINEKIDHTLYNIAHHYYVCS